MSAVYHGAETQPDTREILYSVPHYFGQVLVVVMDGSPRLYIAMVDCMAHLRWYPLDLLSYEIIKLEVQKPLIT